MNTVNARVHRVREGLLLVSPGIFRDYAAATQAPWANVQKRFQKLRLHRKTPEGLNIWTYTSSANAVPVSSRASCWRTRKRRWAAGFSGKAERVTGNSRGKGFAREEDEGEWFSNGKGPIREKAYRNNGHCGKGSDGCSGTTPSFQEVFLVPAPTSRSDWSGLRMHVAVSMTALATWLTHPRQRSLFSRVRLPAPRRAPGSAPC
jgi:hypothetical protein